MTCPESHNHRSQGWTQDPDNLHPVPGLLPHIFPGADGPWGPRKPKEENYREMGKAPDTTFSFQYLLPEAFQVPVGLRKHVWTHGRGGEAVWGTGTGFCSQAERTPTPGSHPPRGLHVPSPLSLRLHLPYGETPSTAPGSLGWYHEKE